VIGKTIAPGNLHISTSVRDCYWECFDSQGNIIDNNFVSIAPSGTVTIDSTDAGFTSNHCGKWTMVG